MSKAEGTILVQVDHEFAVDKLVLSGASARVVRLARSLTSGPVHAVSLIDSPDLDALRDAGADRVLVVSASGFSRRVPSAIADAIVAAAQGEDNLVAILASSTYRGRSALAMVGAKEGWGAIVDVSELEFVEGTFVASKAVLAGSWMTTISVEGGVPLFAIRVGAGPEVGSTPRDATMVPLEFDLSDESRLVQVVSSNAVETGSRVPLTEANVVVVGGRGVDGNFGLVENLADVLGGAVGATRVACDEGWITRSAQIGQTGVSISPKVYVGLGVSGAVHHTCGMLSSEKIVAVVDDPDAPILELADFAVIGDVAEVVPQALRALMQLEDRRTN